MKNGFTFFKHIVKKYHLGIIISTLSKFAMLGILYLISPWLYHWAVYIIHYVMTSVYGLIYATIILSIIVFVVIKEWKKYHHK